MKDYIEINGRRVGKDYPTYIIAEMSANHNQNYERAVEIIKAAKEAGADAVKLQTFTADLHTMQSNEECFRVSGGTLWDGVTLYDLYRDAQMPWEWQPKLKYIANELGMDLFSAAVDGTSVEFLEDMNVPVHKIASFEIVDLELIRKMASTGKPLLLSTGMSTLAEIDEAVNAARSAGATEIVLLKCTSAYPAPPEDVNLQTVPHMSETFGVQVGLSDHTEGIAVPVSAVALGACIVEKHFTLSRTTPGLDSAFSLEPNEFKAMVDAIRTVEKARGEVCYEVSESEEKSRTFRRSLFAVKDIKLGEEFTPENIRSIRPGHGLHPRYIDELFSFTATQDIKKGTPLNWDLVNRKDI